eukprot:CAMPEP_0181324342 /NCGR_PEP_ID=MMETSP1101-20121128/20305_1 /TAXON_ID=46948 /ORGANISM="Rhodomonas abbreviata, Strain Caron Lab Isolate" /LENGTH=128 /DNA_ID=CAMNT_0023432505 /DNA_START=32 /DNA_END=418 /DNA_ORIENTATION=-
MKLSMLVAALLGLVAFASAWDLQVCQSQSKEDTALACAERGLVLCNWEQLQKGEWAVPCRKQDPEAWRWTSSRGWLRKNMGKRQRCGKSRKAGKKFVVVQPSTGEMKCLGRKKGMAMGTCCAAPSDDA